MDWEDCKPKRTIGTLSPLNMVEFAAMAFYRIAPPGVLCLYLNVGLEKFSAEDVERVFKPVEKLVEQMIARKADIIVQSGVPLPILIGVQAHNTLMGKCKHLPYSEILNRCQVQAPPLQHFQSAT